jgi:uncharacterized membrane protein YheB (UPF0754 family)
MILDDVRITLWVPPLAGALIGYATNYLAVWMLFHPRTQIRVWRRKLPFTPGLIPRERSRLAEVIADTVQQRLLSGRELIELLKDSSLKRQVVRTVGELVDEKLRLFPLPETLRYQIKLLLAREIVSQIDAFLDKRAPHVAEGLNVQGAIVSKLNQMDLAEIEVLVRQVSGRHLRFITWFGGVVGFLIGCVQVLIVLWFG